MFLMMLITVCVTAFAIVMTWVMRDSMILVTLIPCVFAETATATGFYFWRRKIESVINYKKEYGEQFIENTIDDI